MSSTPVVIAARRTPIGTAGRGLRALDATTIAATVLAAAAADVREMGLDAPIDDVIMGNTVGPRGNLARVASLVAGLGVTVPGLTVERQCGSGQAAIHAAASEISCGNADLILAGGVESASQAGVPYKQWPFSPVVEGDPDLTDPDMGFAAETVASRCGVSRERQDAYALRSHQLACRAQELGLYNPEIVPVEEVSSDDRPRQRMTLRTLSRMPAAFVPGGTVTAGNSCGISDGAAVVAIVSERLRRRLGVPGLGIEGWATAGVSPATPGIGAAAATFKLLERQGLSVGDLDVIEMTEAFAAQVLASLDLLGVDPFVDERVCGEGGAIALGHPWGASGALLFVRLFSRLVRRREGHTGLAACAIAGGQGLAARVSVRDTSW